MKTPGVGPPARVRLPIAEDDPPFAARLAVVSVLTLMCVASLTGSPLTMLPADNTIPPSATPGGSPARLAEASARYAAAVAVETVKRTKRVMRQLFRQDWSHPALSTGQCDRTATRSFSDHFPPVAFAAASRRA